MSGLRLAVEDRKADAVTHLAESLGVKIQEPAFWGCTKEKSSCSRTAAFTISWQNFYRKACRATAEHTYKEKVVRRVRSMKIEWKKIHWKEKYTYAVLCVVVCILLLAVGLGKGQEKVQEKKKKPAAEKKEEQPETETVYEEPLMRVLIRGDGFVDEVHPMVSLQAAGGMNIETGGQLEQTTPGETVTIAPDHPWFQSGVIRFSVREQGDRICILNLQRGYGVPAYRGILELRTTAEGIAIVNELPMEDYLCGVVPSEMPVSYEIEALKCQAICARSYAYNQAQEMAYPEYGAHVDDSTAFQVYGNSAEAESSNQAVKETAGKRLFYQGQVATAYYYSTSCGRTTDMTAWGAEWNEANAYLTSVAVAGAAGDYESGLPWYRWDAVFDKENLGNQISLQTGTQIGTLVSLEVTKRGAGDIALQIQASGTLGSVTVETENRIRRALGGNYYQITKQDGTVTDGRELLPSAFFTVEDQGSRIVLHGGGFGHGIGMSQNGANAMAAQGLCCEEILKFFYTGVEVR